MDETKQQTPRGTVPALARNGVAGLGARDGPRQGASRLLCRLAVDQWSGEQLVAGERERVGECLTCRRRQEECLSHLRFARVRRVGAARAGHRVGVGKETTRRHGNKDAVVCRVARK